MGEGWGNSFALPACYVKSLAHNVIKPARLDGNIFTGKTVVLLQQLKLFYLFYKKVVMTP